MPKVSVILPCYNHARFLPDSVQGILRQTHSDLELIIVEDCSSDNSWAVIQDLAQGDARIKAIRHERNGGLSKSRNDGLRVATGEFIAFCDADDVWEQEKLNVQVNLLLRHPDADVVYGDTIIIDEHGSPTGQRFSELYPPPLAPSGWLFPELVRRNFINVQSALMRKECLQSVPDFEESFRVLEDWWYWIQLSRRHRFLYSPELVARYRVHSGTLNVQKKRAFPATRFKIYRRVLRKYNDLARSAKAEVVLKMGVDLCDLGRYRPGRRLLWEAVRLSVTDARAFSSLCRALRRIVLHATTLRPSKRCAARS